jgi:hypothetical protein
MATANAEVGARLRRAAELLTAQRAEPSRVRAYRRAADAIAELDVDIARLFAEGGREALEGLPHVSRGVAAAVAEMLTSGRWSLLDRLQGDVAPEMLLQTVPGVGLELARRIHTALGVETLEALAVAAHDGRLAEVPGIGEMRAEAIGAATVDRLQRVRPRTRPASVRPDVATLLAVDQQYRAAVDAHRLPLIAPRRFNPTGIAWLPILHTRRGDWSFAVLFSNTPQAHALQRVRDWVVVYFHNDAGEEGQHTVVTASRGPLTGRRVVRGREAECEALAASASANAATT